YKRLRYDGGNAKHMSLECVVERKTHVTQMCRRTQNARHI
ncbi:3672_t:CDS:1, partial [Entrophospora sp. SA101]